MTLTGEMASFASEVCQNLSEIGREFIRHATLPPTNVENCFSKKSPPNFISVEWEKPRRREAFLEFRNLFNGLIPQCDLTRWPRRVLSGVLGKVQLSHYLSQQWPLQRNAHNRASVCCQTHHLCTNRPKVILEYQKMKNSPRNFLF